MASCHVSTTVPHALSGLYSREFGAMSGSLNGTAQQPGVLTERQALASCQGGIIPCTHLGKHHITRGLVDLCIHSAR